MDIQIYPLEQKHLKQAVEVHLKAFPGFFLSFLGPRFLMEFYRSFIEDEAGLGFVVVESPGGSVVGVVVGPLIPAGYFKRLLKRKWWAFCLASLTAVLKKPSVMPRLFRAVFYRGDAPAQQGLALLSSIAVSPDVQSKGAGRALVGAFIEAVRQKGLAGVFLTTDADNNDKVNRFYQNLGFVLETSYATKEGRKMNRYVMLFSK